DRLPSETGLPITQASWSLAPGPMRVPAWTTTWPPISTSSGSSTPSPSRSPGARSEGRSSALRDMRRLCELALEAGEHAHHPQPRLGAGPRLGPLADALDEVQAL